MTDHRQTRRCPPMAEAISCVLLGLSIAVFLGLIILGAGGDRLRETTTSNAKLRECTATVVSLQTELGIHKARELDLINPPFIRAIKQYGNDFMCAFICPLIGLLFQAWPFIAGTAIFIVISSGMVLCLCECMKKPEQEHNVVATLGGSITTLRAQPTRRRAKRTNKVKEADNDGDMKYGSTPCESTIHGGFFVPNVVIGGVPGEYNELRP